MLQRTIIKPVEAVGIGLHRGKPIRLRLEPMSADSGILFYRRDVAVSIPLSMDSVVDTTMATVIGAEGHNISTIEHLLSVLYAYGIDNLRIIVDGDEVPVMDGSAISFCLLLDEAGIQMLPKSKKVLRIKRAVEVRDGAKFARLEPAEEASFCFGIDFSHPIIGKQDLEYRFSKSSFVEQIARARTFGFAKDIQYLQSRSLALGASLNNAIGLDERKILNSEGLRFDDEFVRHKILDAMGDMMVTGYNMLGRYSAFASSHKLNHALTKELFASSANYEIVSIAMLQNRVYEKSFA